MDVLEAVRERRAVRDHTDRTQSESVTRSLIETAVWAPSGVNLQPWCFVVVDDPVSLAAYSTEAEAVMSDQADVHPGLAPMRDMMTSPEFNIVYNAPAVVATCATTPDEMALEDYCLATQTLTLAAHAEGLGSCWIGSSDAWPNTPAAKAKLGIPAEFRPAAPIIAPIISRCPKGPPHATERCPPDIRYVAAGNS